MNERDSNSNKPRFNDLSKEEIIAVFKKAAKELGHVPTFHEFKRFSGAMPRRVTRVFGGYTELIRAAGFEPLGCGHQLTMSQIFDDWGRVVRRVGKIPSVSEYLVHGRHSQRIFSDRWSSWRDVPAAMIEYATGNRLMRKWNDVLKLARNYAELEKKAARKRNKRKALKAAQLRKQARAVKKDMGPAFGRPIMHPVMANAPINEMGVGMLFAAMATQLGFVLLRVQPGFPDCEALRLCDDGYWRRVRIELEFESRNFRGHGHPLDGCDLIVCWNHNWPGCPLEVIELSKLVERN